MYHYPEDLVGRQWYRGRSPVRSSRMVSAELHHQPEACDRHHQTTNSGGQEFESLRATELGTPKPAVFALDAATSVRSSTLFEPMMRTSFASTSTRWASARR